MTLLREVESLASQQEPQTAGGLGFRKKCSDMRANSFVRRSSARAAISDVQRNCLGVKVTTLNCKIKRSGDCE